MTINDIKNALAAKAQNMNIRPVAPAESVKPSIPAKTKPSTTKTTAPTTTATPVPVTKDVAPVVTAPVKMQNQPMVESETKPIAPKKTTTRKTKTATLIPLDSIEIVVAKYLKAVDYSLIPGCGRKPVLLKAGAEKLAEIYGLRTTSKVINRVERFDQLFVLYEVQTTVYDADGNIVAEGLGSCNSKERRYQKGDFAANLNTVLKMAKKRSYVDAVLTATHASGVFTQDIEDIAVEMRQAEAVG